MTGETLFSALADDQDENYHDAKKILHTLRTTSWGAGAFGLSNVLLDDAVDAGLLTPAEEVFERKFNAGQAVIRHILAIPGDELARETDTDFDYELFYDACLLSWQYLLTRDDVTKAAALLKYNSARERIWRRDGTNAATQRIHFECLEGDTAAFGANCGQSIGVPQYCPIFSLIAE